ncbi:GDSL-type esterase/lipase family protein [Lentibacillus sp. CBA3610]|uniref:GDSL-type esterase/lipase family protein n=1 Tax=Lentibacillus sp. CBA3610 TaxID=2518176 RepID=UPI0015958400|nr:GDSL-type esterase/lipase family protein [Lentibacillus sp. CBA3610]QKY70771.1 lipolytic enzyme, G-D-S-L [Lentibacillus sp. CBA3610]
MQKRVVCFGDSNTWGYNAENTDRFSEDIRWPCLLQRWLGDYYQVVEEGLPGRTSVSEDPLFEGLNAYHYIHPCLKSHAPLELVVIMLGTNDTKERFGLTAYNIAQGIVRLAHKAKSTETGKETGIPKVLVVAPPIIDPNYCNTNVRFSMGKNCDVKSKELPVYLKQLIAGTDIEFLDTSEAVSMNDIDYMHLDKEGHELLAEHVLKKVKEII